MGQRLGGRGRHEPARAGERRHGSKRAGDPNRPHGPTGHGGATVSSTELVALVCCDLGAIVRGRALFTPELDESVQAGVSWVPANHSLTPHGPLAEHTPFGSAGDLRLL